VNFHRSFNVSDAIMMTDCHHNTHLVTLYIPIFDGLDFSSYSQRLKVWPYMIRTQQY